MKIKAQIILIIFFVSQLISCSETLPGKSITNTENSVEFKQTNSLSSRLFGAWSDPELISSIATVDPITSIETNASLAMLENNRFLSWGTSFNQTGNIFSQTEVYSQNIDSSWTDNSPLIGPNQIPRPGKSLKLQTINGNVLAVWEESNTIYSSLFIPTIGWDASTLHGEGNKFHISETDNASLLLVWYFAGQNGTGLSAQQYVSQTGWGNKYSLNAIGNINLTVSKPAKLSNGNYIFVFGWFDEISYMSTIQSARLDPQIGWSAPVLVADVNFEATSIERMEIVSSGDNNAKLFVQTYFSPLNFGIFESNYQFNLGIDEAWSTLNPFIEPNVFATPVMDFEVSTNPTNGDITFIWIDDLRVANNQYQAIQSIQFSTATGWSEKKLISTPLFRFSYNQNPSQLGNGPFLQDLVANFQETGNIDIAWVQVADTSSQLRANQLLAEGIVYDEEIIVTVEPEPLVTLSNIEISSNSTNETRILWTQYQTHSHQIDGNLAGFSLRSSARIPTVNQPITFNPNQPAPALHIATTGNCLACHDTSGVVLVVDHTQVVGACSDCHNVDIMHIPTYGLCGACHNTEIWTPVTTVDHSQIYPRLVCIDCHDGKASVGKSTTHIQTTDDCNACHSTTSWIPITTVDHSQTIGTCESCHPLTPTSHITVSVVTACDSCHSTITWLNPTTPLPIIPIGQLP